MATIWGVMLIILFLIMLDNKIKIRKGIYISHTNENIQYFNPFYFIAIAILVLYSGLRSSIGDTGYYMYSYSNLSSNILDILGQRDWGFSFYQFLLKIFFPHPQALLIFTSLITIFLIFETLRKNSNNLFFSIFLFFVDGIFVSTMNGIRQYLVAAVLFYASSLILKGERTKYIILVIICASIHFSALIMIPIYFIVRFKAWTTHTYFIMSGIVIVFLGFYPLFNILIPVIETTQYSLYANSILSDSGQGAHYARVLVAFVPLFLSFVFRKKLKLKLNHFDIYTNFSLINFVIITFATYNWIFARLSIYLGLYNLILLPAILHYCFDKKTRILLQYLAICLYLVYFYYDLQPHIYSSYYLNINKDLIGPLTRTFYW